ncbi:RNA-directed DNA polymerase from mobile element jockey [Trichonephila clavipes]|nr:RNA-directed DNA polymerase from mobile element jockey [Trichonephila clavipes]
MKSTFNPRHRNRSNLTVISWNANGIRSRIEEFRSFIADWNPDIVNLQETHLQPCHNFIFPDYSIYRTNRTFRGGGTAVMIKRRNQSLIKTCIESSGTEGYVLVAGDLNAKHVSWSPLTQQNIAETLIRRFCGSTGFSLIAPPEPTHFHRSNRSTTIDIAICKGMTASDCSSIPDLSSDHNPVLFEVSLDNYTSPALSTYSFPNCYLQQNYFPQEWKHALITVIPKPGKDEKFPENYRPISLIRSLGKIFEKILLKHINSYCEENNIIPDFQHGFRRQTSTQHQLLRVTNLIVKGYTNKTYLVGMFLDVKKAFDRMWHDGLIYKMILFKFPTYLIKIIHSYLDNRAFNVKLNNVLSSQRPILASTPQGSILSPALYNIYTSDFPTDNNITVCLFADDAAILCTRNTVEEAINLTQKLHLQTGIMANQMADSHKYRQNACYCISKNQITQ